MKKLVLICVLLCCSKAALAFDPCRALNGHAMTIVANGHKAVISNINLFQNTQSFISTILFAGGPLETIEGICSEGHLTFTRARSDPGGFVQLFEGTISQGKISGSYSNGQTIHQWSGNVL